MPSVGPVIFCRSTPSLSDGLWPAYPFELSCGALGFAIGLEVISIEVDFAGFRNRTDRISVGSWTQTDAVLEAPTEVEWVFKTGLCRNVLDFQ
jgi:hypothetical protein